MSLAHATGTTDSQPEPDDLPSSEVLERLNAEYAQQILEIIRTETKPAREIATECGASRATVYRRLNSLREVGLVTTEMQYDADGHHRTGFKTGFESLALEMTDDGLRVRIGHPEADAPATRADPPVAGN